MIALDTNILVYAHRAGSLQHKSAIDLIERALENPSGWGISSSCLSEFWGVVTHSSCSGGASTPREARMFIDQLVDDGGGQVWHPGAGFGMRLLQKAEEMRVSGPRIFDLQIALMAYENGARQLWSYDANFIRLPGLVTKVKFD